MKLSYYLKLQDCAKEKIFESIDNIEFLDSIVSDSISKNDNVLSSEFDEDIKDYLENIRKDMIQVLRMIGK